MRFAIAFLAAVVTLQASIAEARWPSARIVFEETAPMPAELEDAVTTSPCDSCSLGCDHHVSYQPCRHSCGPRFGSNCGRSVPCHGQWHHRIRGFCGFSTVWSGCGMSGCGGCESCGETTGGCESCEESDLQDSGHSSEIKPEAPPAPTEATKSVWRSYRRSF